MWFVLFAFVGLYALAADNYYAVLGVAQECSQKDIKDAYRKKALEWHPDKNPNQKALAEEKFREIGEAYEVLRDPQKRQQYDDERNGRGNHFRMHFDFFKDPHDIFKEFFGDEADPWKEMNDFHAKMHQGFGMDGNFGGFADGFPGFGAQFNFGGGYADFGSGGAFSSSSSSSMSYSSTSGGKKQFHSSTTHSKMTPEGKIITSTEIGSDGTKKRKMILQKADGKKIVISNENGEEVVALDAGEEEKVKKVTHRDGVKKDLVPRDSAVRHINGSFCCADITNPTPVESEKLCHERCCALADCQIWVFQASGGQCFLMRWISNLRQFTNESGRVTGTNDDCPTREEMMTAVEF